jgi:hypothetical protein
MPQRPPTRVAAPAESLANLSLGYNGFTDPTLTNPRMWAAAINVFSGAFGYIQRARFANLTPNLATGLPFTSLKYFALPGLSSYLLGDIAGKLYSYDTAPNPYTQIQRLNPYVDPSGAGSSSLNGPWSRETLQNIVYEMNGQVKMAGRLANAATIEGWGLDTPDSTPQVTVNAGSSVALTNIQRTNSIVTATAAALPAQIGTGSTAVFNITGVSDPTFNGSFLITVSGAGPYTYTYSQLGQNTGLIAGSGNVTSNITKAVGRSYAWAWENFNKAHIGAPSPATQYILYANQNGTIDLIQPGTITLNGTTTVVGSGTFFTSAWIGRSLWAVAAGNVGRIVSVQSATQLTLATNSAGGAGLQFQVFDPQATHIRLYETSDGGATYFRVSRQAWSSAAITLVGAGLRFFDFANAEPPAFPFTTETAQNNNVPPPIGAFVNEYQGRLVVYGVPGAPQSFFYSNSEATAIGQPQESFAPLNQVTLPIQNASMNGMIEFPGSAIIWSDHQDMFRLTGLLTDNIVSATATQQGASIARLPYSLGCASPFATAITPLGGIWLTPNAEVWLYTDRYAPRNIGRPVQDILNSISPAQLRLARATYYHTNTRNWFVLNVAANGATFNNTALILDLDLLAANGSPSYFTFDMASNSPSWFVYQPGKTSGGNWVPRCDSLEVVFEQNGGIRLFVGQIDNIQDIDFDGGPNGGYGNEIAIPNGTVTLHAWGNDAAAMIKHPGWIRFLTNRDPSMLQTDGWQFAVQGIDDDFYTFESPLSLSLAPGVNDTSSLGGNPDFLGGLAFRHSPDLFRIGGVNFVMGRRLKFQVNFPSATGANYRFRGVSFGFGALPSG